MSVLWPTLVASAAASLPAAALAWAAGRLAEALGLAARARAMVWRIGLALVLLATAATPLGLLQRAAPAARRVHLLAVSGGSATATPKAASLPHLDASLLIAPLAGLLLAGAALGLLRLAVRAWRAERMRRGAGTVLDLAAGVPVLVSDEAPAAMLVGLARPAILLPRQLVDALSPEDLELVCAHELAHLARRDNWRILGDQALAALLWFNPPALAAIARLVALREEFCDAAVLASAPAEQRHRYAAVLVQALRLAGGAHAQPAFIRRKGSDHVMRLNAILKPAQSSPRHAVLAAAALLSIAAAGAGLATSALAGQLAPVAAEARADGVKARYESASAADYQRACASDEPSDYGFCTGVIFGVLSSQDPGICQPGTSDYLGMEKQARAAIAAASPEANEGPRVFVSRVLKADFSCEKLKGETSSGVQITSDLAVTKGDVTTFEGSPTIRIIGPIGRSLLLVNGRRPAEDFDVNALPAGAILRITIAKAGSPEAKALGAGPGQAVMNLELKRG